MSWTVIHARPRCEKKVADHCEVAKVEYYLPLRKESKVYQRRRVVVWKPLFPGYLFVNMDSEQREEVLKCNRIARVLEVADEAQLLRELDQIRQALTVDPSLRATRAFREGARVYVRSGPFQGIEGIVQKIQGVTRVILNVDMMGQGVAVEVDDAAVEPVP